MSSYWEDLESQVVARIQAKVTDLADVWASPWLGVETRGKVPWAVVSRGERKRVEPPNAIFGCTRITWDATFRVRIVATLSGPTGSARLGTTGSYSLVDDVLQALVGFMPAPGVLQAVIPVAPETDQIYNVTETSYEALLTFSLRTITQYTAPP